jgi:hypothetical protein
MRLQFIGRFFCDIEYGLYNLFTNLNIYRHLTDSLYFIYSSGTVIGHVLVVVLGESFEM